MSDQGRALEPEGIDHIEGVQGDVEHVTQAFPTLGITIPREKWREHMPAPGERGEKRTVLGDAAGAVQEYQRLPLAGFENADPAAPLGQVEEVRARAHGRATGAAGWETADCCSGWIQKRPSPSYSFQIPLRCGMTLRAKSSVEWRVLSGGMSPTWMPQIIFPTRSVLISSSMRWRTVS